MDSISNLKRIGIFGGSFDPVHVGHLIIAQDALEKLELDEVIFIPAGIPPHKQHLQQETTEHRLNMLKLAVESDIRFSTSELEISRGGISYTFDTVCHFKRQVDNIALYLIIGSDTLVDLHNWYNIDEILELCEVASFMRPGESEPAQLEQKVKLEAPLKERVLANAFESHMVDVSSSEIRMRIAEGLSIRYLVPPEVEMYIQEHGLYRGN